MIFQNHLWEIKCVAWTMQTWACFGVRSMPVSVRMWLCLRYAMQKCGCESPLCSCCGAVSVFPWVANTWTRASFMTWGSVAGLFVQFAGCLDGLAMPCQELHAIGHRIPSYVWTPPPNVQAPPLPCRQALPCPRNANIIQSSFPKSSCRV